MALVFRGDLLDVLGTLLGLAVLFVILNPIADYCSIVETRLILFKIRSSGTRPAVVRLLFLDAALTILIVFVFFSLVWGAGILLTFVRPLSGALDAAFSIIGAEPTPLSEDFLLALRFSVHDVWNGLVLCEEGGVLPPYIYTTFFTSAWIWLYILARIAVQLLPGFTTHFPIAARPFQSIGLVVAFVAGLMFFGVATILQGPDLCIDPYPE